MFFLKKHIIPIKYLIAFDSGNCIDITQYLDRSFTNLSDFFKHYNIPSDAPFQIQIDTHQGIKNNNYL
jgi:hypothetical protein